MDIKTPTATLHVPCETLMSTKTINDKLQGSVATYLRCDGVVNNQIKRVFVSLWVIFKIYR